MVYLIECSRDYDVVYKIGYSKHPNKRIEELKTGNDGNLKLVYCYKGNYDRIVEKTLHNFLSHKKITQGGKEWFRLDLEDVQNFSTLCQKVENNLNALSENGNFL